MSRRDLEYFYIVKNQPEDNILYFWPQETSDDLKLNTVGLTVGLLNFFHRSFSQCSKSIRSDKHDDYFVRVGGVFVCCRLRKVSSENASDSRNSEAFDPTHDERSSGNFSRHTRRRSITASLRRRFTQQPATNPAKSHLSFDGDRFLPHTEYLIRQLRLSVLLYRLFAGGNFYDISSLVPFYDRFIHRFLLRGKQHQNWSTGRFVRRTEDKAIFENEDYAAKREAAASDEDDNESEGENERETLGTITEQENEDEEENPFSVGSTFVPLPNEPPGPPPQLLTEYLAAVPSISFRTPRAFVRVFRFLEHLSHDIRHPDGANAIGCALFQNGRYLYSCGIPNSFLCPLILHDRYLWCRRGDGAQEDLFARMWLYDPDQLSRREEREERIIMGLESEEEERGERGNGSEILKESECEECYLHVMEIDSRLRLSIFFILRQPHLKSFSVNKPLLTSMIAKDKSYVVPSPSSFPSSSLPSSSSSSFSFDFSFSSSRDMAATRESLRKGALAMGLGLESQGSLSSSSSSSSSSLTETDISSSTSSTSNVTNSNTTSSSSSTGSAIRIDYNRSLMTCTRNVNSFFLLYVLADFLDRRRNQRLVIYKLTRTMWIVCLKKSVDSEYCFIVINEKNLSLGDVQQRFRDALCRKSS